MITANFSGLPSDEALVLSTGLWQYDTGQQLRISGISGLSENTEVHFGLKHTDRAIVKTGVYPLIFRIGFWNTPTVRPPKSGYTSAKANRRRKQFGKSKYRFPSANAPTIISAPGIRQAKQ